MRTAGKIVAGLSLALVALVGGFVAVNWAPDRPVAELTAKWAPPPSTFLKVGGLDVHLRDEGPRDDPHPVVLLHGTSASLHTWQGWAEALSAERRVIRFDMPGFGLTGPAPDGDYSLDAYVRCVTAVLDALGVKTAVVGGNSFGGGVAVAFALAHPARVSGLILVDASTYPIVSRSMPIGFRIAQMPVLNRVMENVLPRGMVEASVVSVYGDPGKVTPALVDRYYDLTQRAGNRAALVERFRQAPSGALAPRVPEIKAPTLIVWGGRDGLIPPEHAQWFARDISGSTLAIFPALGHVPHEEDPANTVAAVKLFLRSHR
jgi:pimeloyl-ACP methyl ester carboxylesterase